MKSYLIVSLAILIMTQCATKKLTVNVQEGKLFEMEKSPCFGYCPVYHVTLYNNGLMKLEAKQNMNNTGTYTRQLTNQEVKTIKTSLASLQLHNYKDEYREPIADAPSTRVIYYGTNPEKNIFTNYQFPDSLQSFADKIDAMALSDEWQKSIESRIKTEFILLLEENATLANIIKKYSDYDMMLGKRLDPATNQYWTVSAMIEPGTTDGFIKMLVADPGIKQAQLNRALDPVSR